MKIKAIKLYENGFMTEPFAFGGYVYDPEIGDPLSGIPAGTAFKDLPENWHCPRCKQGKDKFNQA